MNQWLVRTSQNILAGPYSKDQICQLIKDGHLGLQDEVCQANNYWIFLHERDEVTRQLGIEVPKSEGDDEETQTETQTLDPVSSQAHAAASSKSASNDSSSHPSMETSGQENTAMVSSETLRKLKAPPAQKKASPVPAASLSTPVGSSAQSGLPAGSVMIPRPGAPAPVILPSAVPNGLSAASASAPAPEEATSMKSGILGAMERSQFWRGFAWLLVAGVALVIFAVMRLMRSS